jgi:transketolase
VRNQFAATLSSLADQDPRIYIVVADISPAGPMAAFREKHPDRFINVGVAEQSMIGICAGLALRGMRPFAYTIATFALYRPFEFIRDDLAYQGLPVTVVGIGGGTVYSTLGYTHYAQEDVALATSIPNLEVYAPCDANETHEITSYLVRRQGSTPAYLRLGKAGEPDLTSHLPSLDVSRVRLIHSREGGTAIVSYGLATQFAKRYVDNAVDQRVSPSLYTVPCLKPLDVPGIVSILSNYEKVIVIEDHVHQGGLGQRVREIAWNAGAKVQIECRSLPDEFVHCYGAHEEIVSRHLMQEFQH